MAKLFKPELINRKSYQEFDDEGRMRPSPLYDRVVDVMEELVKFTLLVRDRSEYLTDRYSERKTDGPRDASTDLSAIAISHETSVERPAGLPDMKNTD